MNQFVLFHFVITKNDRVYEFSVQPGTPWDDIEEVLEEFKEKFRQLKIDTEKKETTNQKSD